MATPFNQSKTNITAGLFSALVHPCVETIINTERSHLRLKRVNSLQSVFTYFGGYLYLVPYMNKLVE